MKHDKNEIKKAVREHYGAAIQRGGSCCEPTPINLDPDAAGRFVELAGYSPDDLANMPNDVTSFGCGNPVNFIEVEPGQTVLDLGSGAGLDLILAARKVGETGKAIGLDMTPEMIEACLKNLDAAGIKNAEVRQGEMENMPVEDNEVDWIISNCVINLSPEKEKVFAEAYRVLKPGGRMLVSDIVTLDLPVIHRDDLLAWVGCIAGAVDEADYIKLAENAGFVDVKVIDKMVYQPDSLATLANDCCGCGASDRSIDQAVIDRYAGKVASVKLSARKPG